MMTRSLCLSALAFGLLVAAIPQHDAQAQSLTIGRGGVSYNGYGQGYYGGYGRGYRGNYGYAPGNGRYSGYGNGPYGYDTRSTRMFPSNRDYGYRSGTYYNGYGNSGYYEQRYVPVYTPYGFGVYNSYGW